MRRSVHFRLGVKLVRLSLNRGVEFLDRPTGSCSPSTTGPTGFPITSNHVFFTGSQRLGGDPGLLYGRCKLKRFSRFGQTGPNGRSHCLESTYGLRSIIPGHHQRLRLQLRETFSLDLVRGLDPLNVSRKLCGEPVWDPDLKRQMLALEAPAIRRFYPEWIDPSCTPREHITPPL